MIPMMLLLLGGGCVPSPAPGSPPVDPLDGPAPRLVSVALACDVDTATWTATLEADAWTGGGVLYMGLDADTLEEHRMRSVEASAEGDADLLEMTLSIVADWRDAAPGGSTRWRCADEPDLSFQAAIYEVRGEELVDCRFWGADPTLWQASGDGISDCAQPLEAEARR